MNPLRPLLCLIAIAAASAADYFTLVAGTGLEHPFAIAIAADGAMYVSEESGNRVLRLDADGKPTTVVGTGAKSVTGAMIDEGLGGPATKVNLSAPHHLLAAPDGALYIADTYNCRVLRFDPTTGIAAVLAGTGRKGFAGDGGPALVAQMGQVHCLALSPDGKRLYLTDLDNRRIRAIDLASGIIATIAGSGEKGVPADGAKAVAAPLVDPRAVAVDSKGLIYVLERDGHCLRVIDGEGAIRTVAGTGKAGNGGDGDALTIAMKGPKHLCIDRDDSVLIVDCENHLIRRYLPKEHRLIRIAGTGAAGMTAPGAPLETALRRPHGVYIDRAGTMFVVDSENDRVMKLVP